ncbi:MAG: hypothetical protein Q8J72_00305 [Rhodocyclaceae bacterium]|jgi:hypothetical protein|nr:hypothetical protein [Rhodocyclaceae bacterium]MDP3036999.1 hypothetical protein [Rhodocyclaceae bacterium]
MPRERYGNRARLARRIGRAHAADCAVLVMAEGWLDASCRQAAAMKVGAGGTALAGSAALPGTAP